MQFFRHDSVFRNIIWMFLFCFLHGGLNAIEFELHPLGKLNRIGVSLAKGPVFGTGEIKGSFTRVNGKIFFESKYPQQTKGSVLLDTKDLRFGYHKVDGDAQREKWLNSKKFPKIQFNLEGLKDGVWKKDTFFAQAQGTLTIKEKTSKISFPAQMKYLVAGRKKYDRKKGDLLILQGSLPLSRGSFGINPGGMLDIIQDQVSVNIRLVGCSAKSRPLLPSRLFI